MVVRVHENLRLDLAYAFWNRLFSKVNIIYQMPLKNKPIYVTRPSLAPLEEYLEVLKPVWETGILTHNGPMVQKFEFPTVYSANKSLSKANIKGAEGKTYSYSTEKARGLWNDKVADGYTHFDIVSEEAEKIPETE